MRVLELKMQNSESEIGRVSDEFLDFAREVGLTAAAAARVELALDELLTNLVAYAFSDDRVHEIDIRAACADGQLTVTISDDGTPFDPLGAPPADVESSLDEREVGGLGIHLVRHTMDEVSYERSDGRNLVTLKLRLDPPGGSA